MRMLPKACEIYGSMGKSVLSMKIQLPRKVSYIIETLMQHGYEAYAVGGCIRDSLMDRKPDDWDITTSALPAKVKELFRRTIDTGIQHGTVTVLVEGEGFEVTTYRIDGEYEDNRHPNEVIFTVSLQEDLKRRDFTVNAMAYNDHYGLVDIFHGQQDLQQKVIRCVGEAVERFEEDALRILRAVRFAAQLEFEIAEETRFAMRQMASNLPSVSAERIQVELVKLLCSGSPKTLRIAYEDGITAVILPEFDRMMETEQNNPHHCYNVGEHTLAALEAIKPSKVLRLTMLLHDMGKPAKASVDQEGISHFTDHAFESERLTIEILKRLKLDNDTLHRVKRLVRWHDYRFTVDQKTVRRAISKIGKDIFSDLLLVMQADVLAQSLYIREEKLKQLYEVEQIYRQIIKQGECITLEQLAINGTDLLSLGIPKGKQIGAMLQALLNIVLEDPQKNQKQTLLDEARELMGTDTFLEQ